MLKRRFGRGVDVVASAGTHCQRNDDLGGVAVLDLAGLRPVVTLNEGLMPLRGRLLRTAVRIEGEPGNRL
ncbi:MAG: hypothetical protein GEU75_03600 [Dehalococcoidia bacterium]|nr:hypothetical protein [Dehalococcoidia bacterium]